MKFIRNNKYVIGFLVFFWQFVMPVIRITKA